MTSSVPLSWACSVPVATSHSRTVLSSAAEASVRAVGTERHAQDRACAPELGAARWPVATSHSRTVLS